ncbi:Homeobox-leucine zipper protein HDG11 [Camellia lanceoleosa]|uniref:Homeobox-leucine zipper protein HDG11 n=1 Tax=Camellia lanceoleosa TaxID=1840588 RepID=A0ACC0HSY3_9ERIC|nr:Homeobox-leucine zipper protein HDG11 [Camellia lanceoleosa]
MVEFMSSEEFESSSSSRGRKRRYRHSPYQTQMLETFFEQCQHPNERQRCQLGKELGLTPLQIKFWFQNKRTLVKAQNEKTEGHALRAENERLKIENIAAREMLKDEYCKACKGISYTKEDHLHQLRLENSQLNDKYEYLCNLLATMGIPVSKNPSLQGLPSIGSSSDGSENFLGKRMRGLSLGSSSNGSENSIDHTLVSQLKQVQDSDTSRMVQTVSNAIDELTSLFIMDRLWIKDPIDGRHIIQRENYEKIFSRTSHLKSSRTDSNHQERRPFKRVDLFPTIITKATMLQELGNRIPRTLSGSLQLVYEQVHILSPLVGPRDFYFLRYCEEMGKNEWMIVEVSYDIFDQKIESSTQQQNQHHQQPQSSSASPSAPPPSRSWRLPSGCLIRDLNNGCSRITWVEHVEVDDKVVTHRLYTDFICRGLAYGADRWLLTLQRMCQRFAFQSLPTPLLDPVIYSAEGKNSIMNLTHRMVKNLCANLTMEHNQLDIPHLSEVNNNGGFRVSFRKNTGLIGQSDGFIVTAATSLWLPLSSQALFGFFRDEKMRALWTCSNGNPSQEIASISYGNHPENRISVLQPLIPCDNNMLVVQETCIDPLGTIVAYAPIDLKCLDMAASGVDSSHIPILPSGIIISSDGHPILATRDGASTSSATTIATGGVGGSILTMAFQILAWEASSSKKLNMGFVSSSSHLITSTVQNIKSAFNCTGL